MTTISPRGLRHIVGRIEEMASAPHDAAADRRLGLLRRRMEVRVAVAARQLADAASAKNAPTELRRLAASVQAGNTTWEQCVTGEADDLPEVRAWFAAESTPRRDVDYLDEDEDVMLRFLLRRDDHGR